MAPEQKATFARLKSPALFCILLLVVLLLPLLLQAADSMLSLLDEGQLQEIRSRHDSEVALVFTEAREFPIRRVQGLPMRWLPQTQAAQPAFSGQARPGEFFVFQIGVYALKDTGPLAITFSALTGGTEAIPASAWRCLSLGGIDHHGQPFAKEITAAIGNKRVVIKPNFLVTTKQLAATDAKNVEGILEFLKSIGKADNVLITESPAMGKAQVGYVNYGYDKLAAVWPE